MILLFAVTAVALFGLGFVNALWWAVGAVLIFAYFHYGRRGPGPRGRWLREDRRDRASTLTRRTP